MAMPEPALLRAGRTVNSRTVRRGAPARGPSAAPAPGRLGSRVQVLRLGNPGSQPTLQHFPSAFVLEGQLAALSCGLLSSWTEQRPYKLDRRPLRQSSKQGRGDDSGREAAG